MIRTRSAARRLARTAAGLSLAALLTACANAPAHQGAAAVVGDERITVAAVEAKITAVREATAAQPGAPRAERAGLARRTVAELVLDRVLAKALADRGASVSDTEVAQARAADAKLLGGPSQLEGELLSKQGVPAVGIDDFYRQQLGLQKLATAAGQDPRAAGGDEAIRKALVTAGTALRIEVNPRYGHWDPQQIGLTDATEDWLPQNSTLY
ncbi:SurA N-terminal domain-containing protein [Kitasatospora sp. NPDC049258]|uniref:SurA N-terminal domain-containing protein n=1 Tax=Kitasatospora sp. NPDC049258 TaxID=3155394 RepID=UPI003418D2C7